MAGIHNEIIYGENMDFREVWPPVGQITQNGQIFIGGAVSPFLGAGFITSLDSSITWTFGQNTIDASVNPSAGISLRPYIVGATNSDFTTIQAGINQAVTDGATAANPRIVLVKFGTYNENIVGADGVIVQGVMNEGLAIYTVKLNGTVTLSSGTFKMNGINFARTTGNIFLLSGGNLYLNNSLVNQTAGVTFAFTTAASKSVTARNCFMTGDATSTLFSHDGSAAIVGLDLTSSDFNYPTAVNTFAGAAGNFSFSLDDSNWVGSISVTVPTFGGLVQYSQIFGNGVNPFIQTGASTASGGMQSFSNTYNTTVTPYQFGNAGITYVSQYDRTDSNGILPTFATSQPVTRSFYMLGDFTVFNGTRTGYAGSEQFTSQAFANTTDATVTTLASVVVNQLESITLRGTITAAQSDHTNAVGGDFLITARRASGGNVTIVGAAVTNVNSSSAATFTADVDTGTQTVRVRVTGVAATVYNWTTTYSYQKILTNA